MGRRSFIRKPSLRRRVSARTSVKRVVRHNLGMKVPKGYGLLTNPKKAAYNRVYNRTSIGCAILPVTLLVILIASLTIGYSMY